MGNAMRRADLFDRQFEPTIIVCGQMGTGKPHASAFGAADRVEAETAAALMGMHLLPVTEVLKPLASKLPQGRIFGSGRAFVPFVSRKLYAALTEHLPRTTPDLRVVASSSPTPAADDKAGRDEAKNKPFDPELPKDWSAVKPGSLVLAREGERGEGWYEAVVVANKGTDVFELRWLDYPDEPNIVRHRTRVALMFPGAVVDAA